MFVNFEEAKKMIYDGDWLHIAADDSILQQLPKGNWIGGTTPYFITEEYGGTLNKDMLFIDKLDFAADCNVQIYDEESISKIVKNSYDNGVTFLIIPFASKIAACYSEKAPNLDGIFLNPVVGWISGMDLSTSSLAKVYNGTTGEAYNDKAVALHIKLFDTQMATINIVNIFDADENSDIIEFDEDTLTVHKCKINGVEENFADYLYKNKIDIRMPLIANYSGINVNVSIKSADYNTGKVDLYANVFKNEKYQFARKITDYSSMFNDMVKNINTDGLVFSCNCILNYIYGELENKKITPFNGPVTFGEIAYQLLNQTLVYLNIINK